MYTITYKKFTSVKLIFLTFLFFTTFQIRAQFPFFESFKDATATRIEFGGTPAAYLTGGTGNREGYNDLNGDGYLRLTNKQTQQQGTVWSNTYAFPSAYGMTISFEYYTHGGNGADGIAFILFDAAASPIKAGAFGGSLGYAQGENGVKGFSGGYLGVGIDEFGNFSSNLGKTDGVGQLPSSITLRGAGSGTTGYPYLTSKQTTVSPLLFNLAGMDRSAIDNTKAGFRKIEIALKPRTNGGFFIDIYITHGNVKDLIINNYEYTTPAPSNLKFALSSSTGNITNFHEIRNLNLSVDLSTLLEPKANPVSFSGCAGLKAETAIDINVNNNGTVNTLGTINRESVDLDTSLDGIQVSKTVPGKGTFTYNSITGKVAFTPENTTIEGTVAIDYTFNDSYGKTSNISTITYSNSPADTTNNSCLASLKTDVTSLTKSILNIPDEIVSYEVKITNSGNGNAKNVSLYFLFSDGVIFDSATAIYTGNASGPTGALSYVGLADSPTIGEFNIPINGTVTILLKGKTSSAIESGTYNVAAQAEYFDPVQTSRRITPFINGFAEQKTYASGEKVSGFNFNGAFSLTDDVTVNPKLPPIVTTGVTICKGETGLLTATNSSVAVTTFSGHWNAATDPQAFVPYTYMNNSTTCQFYTSGKRNYTATTFTVSLSGIYKFTMTDTNEYDGAAYIYSGNFTPGNCSGGGTWIIGTDDNGSPNQEPIMTTNLVAGVTYTLISTVWANNEGTFIGDYTWTVEPPAGGQFLLNTLNYWYSSATGGTPIGWGNFFNPVGIIGSGLLDTNTTGTKTYYVDNGTDSSSRTPADFVITNVSTVGNASISPNLCINTALTNITHTTTEATGIGTATGLPKGVIASWNLNIITISGTPTESGVFEYSIPLTGGCGNINANGTITVTSPANVTTTGVEICKGETGLLTATSGSAVIPAPVTVFTGTWNATTDPKSLMPARRSETDPKCLFHENIYGSYKEISFSVNISGTYSLQMTGENVFYRAGYIYKGNYLLGTCPEDGTWIAEDDDYGFIGEKTPVLTAYLEVGTLYTLVSIINAYNDPNYTTDYTWTLTPPIGGGFYLTPVNLWYADMTGGDPIGWGPYLNPVEVPNSGMLNTNTPGSTTYYAGDASSCSARVPATFIIKEDNTVGLVSATPTLCINTVLTDITHTTTGATGIGTAKGLPEGVTAAWNSNIITISGTPREAGTFEYLIPLTGECGDVAAIGKITVRTKPTAITTTENICAGEKYTWAVNGIEYSESASVTVEKDGCTADEILNLTIGSLSASLIINSILPEFCAGDKDGSFSIQISEGNTPYSYSLDKQYGNFSQGLSEQKIFDFVNLSGGKHIVYIKDSSGCSNQLEVNIPDGIAINPVVHIDTACKNNASSNSVIVTIDKTITNPDDVDYALDKEDGVYQIENIFTNVISGNHIIYARHANGCIQPTKEFSINHIEPLALTLADGELNEIVATTTGGAGQYRYSLDETANGTANKFIIYKSGMYTVTVTDQNGCTATASRYFEYIDLCIPNHFTPNGDGINDEWDPDAA
ncbi:hypothetical protein [Flavobacterium sp.]|uniref:hypothetical protein n=1 Tax=Flavobacterium sp. TaxID=239 RepID=UPI00374DD3CB